MTAAPQLPEEEIPPMPEPQASAQSEPVQEPRPNNPGVSVVPMLQGGGSLSKAGVSIASMMAVALSPYKPILVHPIRLYLAVCLIIDQGHY